MKFTFYQAFFVILGAVMLLKAASHFLRHRKSWREFIVWMLLWGGVIFMALRPDSVDHAGAILGFSDGAHGIIFPTLLVFLYCLARLFLKIELLEQKIAELARHIALNDKNKFP